MLLIVSEPQDKSKAVIDNILKYRISYETKGELGLAWGVGRGRKRRVWGGVGSMFLKKMFAMNLS